jgi:hypothetical protein
MARRNRAAECIGQTYAELQAMAIALAGSPFFRGADPDVVVERLIAEGWVKRCSQHPDHYLLNRKKRLPSN